MGPRQVRIKVQAAGVSFATSLVVAGKYQRKPPLPFIPGTECSGYVTCWFRRNGYANWRPSLCCLRLGGQAGEAVAHSSNVFKIPQSLPFNEAICFTNSFDIIRRFSMATSVEKRSICSGPRSSRRSRYSCYRNFKIRSHGYCHRGKRR